SPYLKQAALAARASRLATVTFEKDGTLVRVWDVGTRKAVGPPLRQATEPDLVALDADGERLLVLEPGGARGWDAATGRPARPAMRQGQGIVSAAIAPDGDRVVTVSEPENSLNGTRPLQPGEAQVWWAETGRPVVPAFRHAEDVQRAFFAAGGDQLV